MGKHRIRLRVADDEFRYSADWGVTYSDATGDVVVSNRNTGAHDKLTLHPPRGDHPDWIAHLRRAHRDGADSIWKNVDQWIPYQPVSGLFQVCQIWVPHSQVRLSPSRKPPKQDTIILAPAAVGQQVTLSIWLHINPQSDWWPGCEEGSNLVGSVRTGTGAALLIVRGDEPAQKIVLPKQFVTEFRRDHSSRANIQDLAISMFSLNQKGFGVWVDFMASRLL